MQRDQGKAGDAGAKDVIHGELSLLWVGDHVGRPIQALVAKPGLRELLAAFAGEDGGNGGLVGFGGSGGERERHFR